jgi:hypothetical protein
MSRSFPEMRRVFMSEKALKRVKTVRNWPFSPILTFSRLKTFGIAFPQLLLLAA